MTSATEINCVVVLGPTATGKTRLAVTLARAFHGEIVSADSRQVYRGMDVGTGKDLAEYGRGDRRVPAHMIDVAAPDKPYNLHRYAVEARRALRGIARRGHLPVVCGGSHLYIDALIRNYALAGGPPDPHLRRLHADKSDAELGEELRRINPAVYARTDTRHRPRLLRGLEIARQSEPSAAPASVPLHPLLIGPYFPRPEIHQRIETRLDQRIREGLLDEVRHLHDAGVAWERLEFLGLEYRFAARHLRGDIDADTFRNSLLAAIRRFCKAQEIWLRKLEREGWAIHWISGGNPATALELTRQFLAGEALPPPEIRLNDRLYGPRTQ